jgi:hypothetical protein
VSIPIEAAERILSLIVGSDVQIKGE